MERNKKAIISEMEENLILASNQHQGSYNSLQGSKGSKDDDVYNLLADRDVHVTKDAIYKGLEYGVDRRFIDITHASSSSRSSAKVVQLSKGFTINPSERLIDGVNSSILDEQFEAFLSRLELLESEEFLDSNTDTSSLSVKDKLLAIKLPKSSFEPLLGPLRSTRPPLYQAVVQHSLLSGKSQNQKTSKKMSKKEKRKDRNEKELNAVKEALSTPSTGKGGGWKSKSKASGDADTESVTSSTPSVHDSLLDSASAMERNKEILATFIAKAIAERSVSSYLLVVALLFNLMKQENASDPCGESYHVLPVANIIAALFEPQDADEYLVNPFKRCILPSVVKGGSTVCSEISRGDDSNSLETGNVDDSQSHSGLIFTGSERNVGSERAFSDAGSTVGSIWAEQGTETASIVDDDEEEQLVQALAMSMSGTSSSQVNMTSAINIGSTSNNNTVVVSFDSVRHPNIGDFSESASILGSSAASVTSSVFINNVSPDKFPQIFPLSSHGSLWNKDFWNSINVTQTNEHMDLLPSLSLRTVIFALLTILSVSVDTCINQDPCVYLKDLKCPITETLTIEPHPMIFLLLEMLLDNFIDELKRSNDKFPQVSGSQIDSLNLKDVSLIKEWQLHRYFLVWSIAALLRVLQANLVQASNLRMTPSSLGLSVGVGIVKLNQTKFRNDKDNINGTGHQTGGNPSMLPFVLRLLQRVADCMGLDHAVAGSYDSNIDTSLNFAPNLLSEIISNNNKLYRHGLRMTSVDVFIQGLTFFRQSIDDRALLLKQLLQSTPRSSSVEFRHYNIYCPHRFSKSSGTTEKIPPLNFYKLYLLQKLCEYFSTNDTAFLVSNETFTTCESSNEFLNGEKRDEISVTPVYNSIETGLIHRLNTPDIMSNVFGSDSNYLSYNINSVASYPFAGELQLLKALQKYFIKRYQSSFTVNKANVEEEAARFAYLSTKCSPDINILNDGKTALFTKSKTWGSVAISSSFKPNSGVHEWAIKVEKSDRGNIFVGIVAEEANMETYVGGDAHGWGIIGVKAAWHNERKVKSITGPEFASDSVVRLRLDTSKMTLQYCVSHYIQDDRNDWVLVFDKLPMVTFHPAVSMHHREDKLTLLYTKTVFSAMRIASGDSLKKKGLLDDSIEAQSHFIGYFQQVCSVVDNILNAAETSQKNGTNVNAILSHPFFGAILPSLSCAILTVDYVEQLFVGYQAIQLIPYMLQVIRKLSAAYDMYAKDHGDDEPDFILTNKYASVIADISGSWIFKSSTSSSRMPAQEYKVKFDQVFDVEQIKSNNSLAVKINGNGKGSVSSVSISGTKYGTRLKLLETWAKNGGTCVLDGRLSLCGCFFSGSFHDSKAGDSGMIEGYLSSNESLSSDKEGKLFILNVLFKVLTLCCKAYGKLCGYLVIGIPAISIGNIDQDSNIQLQSSNIGNDVSSSDRMSSDASLYNATDAGDDPAALEEKNVTTENKWVDSNIFSGGLPLDEEMLRYLSDEIKLYTNISVDFSEINNLFDVSNASSYDQLLSSWLSRAFPIISNAASKTGNFRNTKDETILYSVESATVLNEDKIGMTPIDTDINDMVKDVAMSRGSGLKLDEYVLHHIGRSELSKRGGEVVATSRQLVLAALIKHCGCNSLCMNEYIALSSGKKDKLDRPHPLLIEIWRATQRVIEDIVRYKNHSGLSFGDVCKAVTQKAQLLIAVQPNISCVTIQESLKSTYASTYGELSLPESMYLDSYIQQNCSKLLEDVENFFKKSTLKDISGLYAHMKQSSLRALTRTAGLSSFMMLFNRDASNTKAAPTSFSGVNSVKLQATVIEYILLSLNGISELAQHAAATSSRNHIDIVNSTGHYSNGLSSVSSELTSGVRSSFYNSYEFIAQLLTRCTWANDRDAQCTALSAWGGISILTDDHTFLNRANIFHVLQTVLDNVRSSMSGEYTPDSTGNIPIDSSDSVGGPFAVSFTSNSRKRLSQLVLKVVHTLASQVAFLKDPVANIGAPPSLERFPSGPDTLSQSLFTMLYTELYTGMRSVILQFMDKTEVNDEVPIFKTKSDKSDEQEDSLEGEHYIYRILRLLYFVSSSAVCQKSLLSPKWLTLFFLGVGCGGLGVQRRILRLLRRLLVNVDPVTIKPFIPSMFSTRQEIIGSETPFDEDDIEAMIKIYNDSSSNIIEPASKVIYFFLEGVSIILPIVGENNQGCGDADRFFFEKNQKNGTAESLSAESLLMLRVLQGVPAWRNIINVTLQSILIENNNDFTFSLENPHRLRCMSAALSVFGGYIDRLRIGGIAILRPFSLVNFNEHSLGNKLAGVSKSCCMLVGLSPQSSSVEVVLMERGVRLVTQASSSASMSSALSPVSHMSQLSISNNSVNNNVVVNESSVSTKTIQHTTSMATTLPVLAVKLNKSDLMPSSDVPVIAEFVSSDLFGETVKLIQSLGITWLKEKVSAAKQNCARRKPRVKHVSREDEDGDNDGQEKDELEELDDDDNNESGDNQSHDDNDDGTKDTSDLVDIASIDTNEMSNLRNKDALKLFAIVSAFRATSVALQSDNLVLNFIELATTLSTPLFKDIIELSVEESHCGGLNVIESIEERWTRLWDLYSGSLLAADIEVSSNSPVIPKKSDATTSEAGRTRSSGQNEQNDTTDAGRLLGRSILEAAVGMLSSPFGGGEPRVVDTAAQEASISQMVDIVGLPREWCEVALRRCRYNVEMAINMCFEQGGDMSQIVAEDAMMQAAMETQRRGSGGASSSQNQSGSRNSLGRIFRTESRRGVPDASLLIRQLLEMGFPPSWCSRAMEATGNNVDAALSWILSHGEELAADEEHHSASDTQLSGVTNGTSESAESIKENIFSIVNPLCILSGSCRIKSDLTVKVDSSGQNFPSIGCRSFMAKSGKWYYETTILTNGCIQIGWADGGYRGNADQGQGVGDDINSWAFDGYRMYLWHESSADWGARWAVGDVVGCAVDIDNREMRFTLNGLDVEIDMGLAFTGFDFQGGLFPCVSLSHNESIQFNFGSTPLINLPEGFQPFIAHVLSVAEQNSTIPSMFSDKSLVKCVSPHLISAESDLSVDDDSLDNRMLEGLMEESQESDNDKNDRVFDWRRRYFNEESRSSSSSPPYPIAVLPSLPKSNKDILPQFSDLSKDLCILYCRVSILRVLNSFGSLTNESQLQLVHYLAQMLSSSEQSRSGYALLMQLIRLCAISTNRTTVYIHIMSLLPSSVAIPANLGSIFSTGGVPMLNEVRSGVSILLTCSRSFGDTALVSALLDHLLVDCLNATRRDLVDEWKYENGFAPIICSDGDITDEMCMTQPSLGFAVWITTLLFDQFISEVTWTDESHTSSADKLSTWDLLQPWFERIIQCWVFALSGSSFHVKTCAMRVISLLFQEFTQLGARLQHAPSSIVEKLLSYVPIKRIENYALRRILKEKSNLPVCSDHLQSALDLVMTLRQAFHNELMVLSAENSPRNEVSDNPDTFLESEFDFNDPEFNWETISGRLFADDGWDLLTGSMKQLKVNVEIVKIPPAVQSDPRKERGELPPELLLGCKVLKVVISNETVPDSSKEVPKDSETASGDSPTSKTTSSDVIGTVIGVGAWTDDLPGTSRIVKWDTTGETETIRWGSAGGHYDVTHVQMKGNKVVKKYPHPIHRMQKLANSMFGTECNYGVILRFRRLHYSQSSTSTSTPQVINKIVGLLEIPDFGAIIFVVGCEYSNGSIRIEERRLVSGLDHTGWSVRFGVRYWRPGTIYDLHLPNNNPAYADRFSGSLTGTYKYDVTVGKYTVPISGSILLQRSRLFSFDNNFDEKNKPQNVGITCENMTVTKGSKDGQALIYANVGFASGVHYWEFKIDQNEQHGTGSIYIGVSEKPQEQVPGHPYKFYSRWSGCGFISNRVSFKGATSHSPESVRVYGECITSGDLIGVLLDMNRGRISFFLDGLKFGEHVIADLGEAHTNLATPYRARAKTLFPVIGLNRCRDIVAITPRWLSSIGVHQEDEFRVVQKAWGLLSSWSLERPTSMPCSANMWAYRYAWRDWRRWLSSRYFRVRIRCKSLLNISVVLDISPRACIDASIRLGLPMAYFRGDRILISKLCGKPLEQKEEALILGAYKGQLWYRLDTTQQSKSSSDNLAGGANSSDSIMESSSLAWSLVPYDVEGLQLISRGIILNNGIPASVLDAIKLPRIPAFQGGMIYIGFHDGAIMRNGIEIDHANEIMKIPTALKLYATERRVNSSNIVRYHIFYNGNHGWISERMRSEKDELMVQKILDSTQEEIDNAKESIVDIALSLNLISQKEEAKDVIYLDSVATVEEGLKYYENALIQKGFGDAVPNLLSYPSFNNNDSLEEYLSLASTIDGTRQWSVEADMQLSELISRCSSKEGVTPFNLSHNSLLSSLRKLGVVDSNSILSAVDPARVVARAALLRVTNQAIGHALPYLSISLPEEKLKKDACGNDGDIEIIASNMRNNSNTTIWSPPCSSRRLRSLRRVLFQQTKVNFWDSVLDATSTYTPLHQEDFEDPKEIKVIKINRIKARFDRLALLTNPSDRLKASVFGQLHREMKSWNPSAFRRSYIGKGHGGQRRAFKVNFNGEGVNDYGGPYRAVFEQIVDEIQCDNIGAGSVGKTLLPLVVPCPNRASAVGANQDKYLLSTAPPTPSNQELMHFFGKLVGTAVRHHLTLGLDVSSLLWRPLVRLPLSRAHLETVDHLAVKQLEDIIRKGLELEELANAEDGGVYTSSYRPDEWTDYNFTVSLADGSRIPLKSNGDEEPLTLGNWREYVDLVERLRLRESVVMFKCIRDGISCVLPSEILPIFTSTELEQVITGSSEVDVQLLKQLTEYEDIAPDSKTVSNFWEVLTEMSGEERTLFLRFVWARSRMPSSAQESSMNFKIQGAQGAAKEKPDTYLPHAQTCFFSLTLPEYSTKEIMRAKIIYAINNSPNMDADVRLHSAEGWAEG